MSGRTAAARHLVFRIVVNLTRIHTGAIRARIKVSAIPVTLRGDLAARQMILGGLRRRGHSIISKPADLRALFSGECTVRLKSITSPWHQIKRGADTRHLSQSSARKEREGGGSGVLGKKEVGSIPFDFWSILGRSGSNWTTEFLSNIGNERCSLSVRRMRGAYIHATAKIRKDERRGCKPEVNPSARLSYVKSYLPRRRGRASHLQFRNPRITRGRRTECQGE